MENITTLVNITATSNKKSDNYDTQRKTVYFIPKNETERKKLINFGLTEYTPKDANEKPFFIVKMTELIKFWRNGSVLTTQDTSINDINFKFVDGLYARVNIIKSSNLGNDFYRINAIELTKNQLPDDLIEYVTETNPFE